MAVLSFVEIAVLVCDLVGIFVGMATSRTRHTTSWVTNSETIRRNVVVTSAIGGMGVFLLFGSLTLLYFWLKVPETKGKSLQELEEELVG